jgi:serine/threonine protein kinase
MNFFPGDLILSRYRLAALLGKGAYASVYRAIDEQSGAPVALKVFSWQAANLPADSAWVVENRARFRQEAELGMRLDHPRLVRVYDFCEGAEALITAMELLPGGSLLERLPRNRPDQQPYEIDQAVTIALQIAEGLAALHQREIVHRDLHPCNILFDAQDELKIADLGLAQIPGGVTLYTQFGSAGGTTHPGHPDYCSPEHDQLNRRLAPAADIYGLGGDPV